jgi:hypothetical protein
MQAQSYKDLIVWQKGMILAKEIYDQDCSNLLSLCEEISKMLRAIRHNLNSKPYSLTPKLLRS